MALNENWIVRTKKNLRIGDMVTPLRTPRKNGIMHFAPVTGVVAEITPHHIRLEVAGSEESFYVYSGAVFAVNPEWYENEEGDASEED